MNYIIDYMQDGIPRILKTTRAVDPVFRVFGEFAQAKASAITECLGEMETLRAHIAKLRGLREKQVQNEPKETYEKDDDA